MPVQEAVREAAPQAGAVQAAIRTIALIQNHRNQAIYIPKEFEFKGVKAVEVERRGEELVLRPARSNPMDIDARLRELALLSDGWLDGNGRALDGKALAKLARAFEARFAPELPPPYLYPTPEGNVLAEWSLGAWEVSLEIALDDFSADFQALHTGSGEERESALSLDPQRQPDGWETLNANLAALLGAAA